MQWAYGPRKGCLHEICGAYATFARQDWPTSLASNIQPYAKARPKRLEHARVQGGPMQLKCGEGGHIEKAGPRVETTSTLCLISAEVQFKCRRSGAKVV